MTILLYDLSGRDDRRFSPYCWRTRMALAHKGLGFETKPTRFTEIPEICGGGQPTVPVLDDGESIVGDSFHIAEHLERSYPDRPSLFGDAGALAYAHFLHHWTFRTLHPRIVALIIDELMEALEEPDTSHFRTSREARYGCKLEDLRAEPEAGLRALREILQPVRDVLADQPFLCGDAPAYADYVLFGSLQWPRLVSALALFEADDPIAAWFERCLNRYQQAAPN